MKTYWTKFQSNGIITALGTAIFDVLQPMQADRPSIRDFTLAAAFGQIALDTDTAFSDPTEFTLALGYFNESATGSAEIPDPADTGNTYQWHYVWHLPSPLRVEEPVRRELHVKTQRKVGDGVQPLMVLRNPQVVNQNYSFNMSFLIKY